MDANEYWRSWWGKNRERWLKKRAEKREVSRAEFTAACRKWRQEHPEMLKKQSCRNSLYRKFRRNGFDRETASREAGVKLTILYKP